jgi:hypothetical protein
MAIADWTVPFRLTSTPYTDHPIPATTAPNPLPINTATTLVGGESVIYRLKPDGCSMTNVVRETKDYVPQADGAILHHRFVGGMEAQLTFQMWQNDSKIACDHILQEMVDTLEGYLYGLINAGDNEGRLTWAPVGGASGAPGSNGYRMMEDIRLLSYPVESQAPGAPLEVVVTIDCERPYCEDETQLSPAVPGTVVNYGNRPTYPVYKIYGNYTSFTLKNTTTGEQFAYDGALPGAMAVGPGDYMEIDTFHNTLYLNGAGANLKPGVVMVDSDFSPLVPGNNVITCPGVGAASIALVNAAWA